MAVDDLFTSQPYETSTIVLPRRRFFPCDIQVKHWQLRNLISSDRPNIINYISIANVLQLDLNTNKVSLIADLTFIPRCSASGYGYICAAGEEGGLIAIINTNTSESAEVDEQVPMPGIQHGDRSARRSGSSSRPPVIKIDEIGSSIINSIAIYKIKGDPSAGICDDIVAVLTNNDMTVRILSLSTGHETAVLDLSFAVNHATISPDGQTLVAVGDFQQAHFFEKVTLDPKESRISTARYASDHCRWVLLSIVKLHYPLSAGISGYFSSAWSPSSALCAVASENGYITVMNVQKLRAEEPGEDCKITVISSTRPHEEPGPGSIRTLHFSCQPWELLVWSEGRGRICAADMRYGLNSRQILHLKPDTESTAGMTSLIQVSYGKDVQPALLREPSLHREPSHAHISPRYDHLVQHMYNTRRQARAEPLSNAEFSPRTDSRRRVTQLLRNQDFASLRDDEDPSSSDRQALSTSRNQNTNADERMILEVLRSATHTTEPVPPPRSIRYRPSEIHGSRANVESIARLAERDEHITEAMNILRRHRGESELYSSEMLANAEASVSARRIQARYNERAATYAADARSRLRSQLMHEDSAGASSSVQMASRHRAEEDDLVANYDQRLRRAYDRQERLREKYKLTSADINLLRVSSLRNREDGPASAGMLTAGVIVGSDGQTIWAGCQEGIFEFKLNMRDLMNCPSLEAR